MGWGINKFAKKLIAPDSNPNNELLDFLSRVPNDETLQVRPQLFTADLIYSAWSFLMLFNHFRIAGRWNFSLMRKCLQKNLQRSESQSQNKSSCELLLKISENFRILDYSCFLPTSISSILSLIQSWCRSSLNRAFSNWQISHSIVKHCTHLWSFLQVLICDMKTLLPA